MRWIILALMACAATAPHPLWAQTQQDVPKKAVQRAKLRALLADGYEIKSTIFIPQEASTRVAGRPDHDAVVISLQKGQALATCFHQLRNYVAAEVMDVEWCIPHQ